MRCAERRISARRFCAQAPIRRDPCLRGPSLPLFLSLSLLPFPIASTASPFSLQSIRIAEKITQKVEGQLSKSQKEFLPRQQQWQKEGNEADSAVASVGAVETAAAVTAVAAVAVAGEMRRRSGFQ